MRELLAVHVGLVDLRRILRNVGGNLNDVARHANVTGTPAAKLPRCRAWSRGWWDGWTPPWSTCVPCWRWPETLTALEEASPLPRT